ncbi:toll-like receptor 4 [Saccostrea echinata]|uniref:toll-like receptor 4 n=1 Tax=Saccostrea echinata TaxID=191078 RepID=UPI002A81341E|nr:toll-like receptor 4 [Saccostrea echinata]XP_061165534.1 toll-like receptor 4 [Saccostrea echinata]
MECAAFELGFLLTIMTMIRIKALSCSSNKHCVCYRVNGQLWAKCEYLDLKSAPSFNSDVIGINLANNELSTFPANLPFNIRYLDVSRNQLRNIDQQSLVKYKYLRNLSISENSLQTIELGSFKNSSNLLHLDISGNQELTLEVVANISSDFRNSASIRVLNFEKLQCTYGVSFIVKRYHTAYLKYTQLEDLNLASNRINSLELGVLTELPKSLKHLNLANNVLSFGLYLAEFGVMDNMVTLNASFQSSFHQLKIKDFFIGCNDTRPVCATMSENQHGNLVSNNRRFSSLLRPKNITIYLPPKLKSLYFHDNLYKMTLQDFAFTSVTKSALSKVYLQNNIIYEMNGPITGIDNVVYMDLSNNFCSNISPRFFEDFKNLCYLDLSHNALGENLENDIDGKIFQNLRTLNSLNLTRNRIVRLPTKIFRNLKQIEILNLSYNSLSEFTVPINQMVRLSHLDLSNNQISTMNTETRNMLDAISQERLVSVNLKSNKLRCNCENLEFMKWVLKSKNVVFLHLDDYLCTFSNSSRIRFSNIELLQLMEKQCSSYTLIIVIMTSLIIVLLTITISRILYRYRWKLRYMYYVAREKYKDDVQRPDTLDDQYYFDAFLSYADKDRIFVIDLVKRLEKEFNLRLCIHHRDFIPGTGIADNITNAIHYSRKTVCVITSHFLQSYWCMFELNMARMEAIYSRNGENVLFLVALEKGAMKKIPFSFMDLIESKSYIEFPEGGDKDEVTAFRSKLGDTLRSHDNDFRSAEIRVDD